MRRAVVAFILLILFIFMDYATPIYSIKPVLYTKLNEVDLDSNGSIIWIIIDDNPKNYWITMHENNSSLEEYLRTPTKVLTSMIEFSPKLIPSGSYYITLHLSDFSGNLINSTVLARIMNPIYSTVTGTSSSLSLSSSSTLTGESPGVGSFLMTITLMLIIGVGFSRSNYRKKKK